MIKKSYKYNFDFSFKFKFLFYTLFLILLINDNLFSHFFYFLITVVFKSTGFFFCVFFNQSFRDNKFLTNHLTFLVNFLTNFIKSFLEIAIFNYFLVEKKPFLTDFINYNFTN